MSKNTRNRILLTALAALLLVTLTIGGTMAWLTAKSSEVVNNFTSAELGIELKETESNWSKQLIPGKTYEKDPNVTVVADSDVSAWIFVEILEGNNSAAAGGKKVDYNVDTEHWVKVNVTPKHPGAEVYLYKTNAVAAGSTVYVLTGGKEETPGQVTVSGNVTEADMTALPSLTFYAYAVQSDNLTINNTLITATNVVDNAAAIWALAPNAQ